MKSTLVYLIDDDQSFRRSLAFMLEGESIEVREFASGQDFLTSLAKSSKGHLRSGTILSDIRMPNMTGLELQSELNKKEVELPLVFMTAHGDVAMAVEAMRKGAADFLEKPFTTERLFESLDAANRRAGEMAIERAAQREKAARDEAIVNGLAQEAKTKLDPAIEQRINTLSPRERQVFEMVIQGKLNKVIADTLLISIKTVEMHRANMMNKMQAASIIELLRMSAGYILTHDGIAA